MPPSYFNHMIIYFNHMIYCRRHLYDVTRLLRRVMAIYLTEEGRGVWIEKTNIF